MSRLAAPATRQNIGYGGDWLGGKWAFVAWVEDGVKRETEKQQPSTEQVY